ncbi:MAG: hypothetical protein ABFS17_03335 [Chloroflexota bacterium]
MTYDPDLARGRRERDAEPHPFWRGVGIAMMILIPIISFIVSDLFIQWMKFEKGFRIPDPLAKWDWDIPGYGYVNDALAVVLFSLIVMMIVFAILTIINAIAYRATSNKNLMVFESEPGRYKRKRKLVKPTYEKPKRK